MSRRGTAPARPAGRARRGSTGLVLAIAAGAAAVGACEPAHESAERAAEDLTGGTTVRQGERAKARLRADTDERARGLESELEALDEEP